MADTILVTAIGGNVATGIIRCLNDYKLSIIGCDINEYPMGIDLVKKFYRVPLAIDDTYIPTILDICDKNEITHIIPVNEVEIRVINHHRELFKEHGIHVIIQSPNILDICFDKYLCSNVLAELGVNVPQSMLPTEFIEDGDTYIAKLRTSSGSKLVKIISTKRELDELELQYPDQILVQQYISGENQEYTIGVFSDGCDVRSISFKRDLQHGYSSKIELVHDESLSALANTVAKGLNLVGSINIQLRKMNGRNYVFEINPRLSGTVHFRHLLGFQDAVWWYNLVSNYPLPPYINKYHKAIGIREIN